MNRIVYKRSLTTRVLNALLEVGSQVMKPLLGDRLESVSMESDLAYTSSGEEVHLMDVYQPLHRHGAAPVVFYVHGGGFTVCSKESHWMFGAEFARRGYVVLMPNYRLAPEHPFPAGLQDVFRAWQFFVENAQRWQVDLSRVVVAGESAGANLSLAVALATVQKRREPYAQALFDLGVKPKAIVAACGALGLTTLKPEPHHNAFITHRLRNIRRFYLEAASVAEHELELADSLLGLERVEVNASSWPPTFIPCGTEDPILKESQRLADLMTTRSLPHELRLYEKQGHAFHALLFKDAAKQCWDDTFAFLECQGVGPPKKDE